ncbi:MAG: DUF4352 domain-containing protein [Chloroflexi bacterium]|nr:DUF4352 domain-containing protein [Chloroflexota bacterium]
MKLRTVILLLAPLLLVVATAVPWQTMYALPFVDPALSKAWERTDWPVASGVVARTWILGPAPFFGTDEIYGNNSGETRQVQYYDKSRMEISDPWGDRASPWFVTSGLLVKELISGNIQTGDHRFQPYVPAAIPVAGDPTSENPNAPTYASLKNLASLSGNNRASIKVGQPVTETIDTNGSIGADATLSETARIAIYDEQSGHNIPDVFWTFLNSRGIVFQQGAYVDDTLVNWLVTTGLPLTEPYWARVTVSGEEKNVLIQAFERRVLTFTPSNQPNWQVEMGNVGRHYYWWRYQSSLPMLQPVRSGNWEVKVNSAVKNKTLVGGRYLGSKTASGIFVTVFLTIKNLGQEAATLPDTTLVDSQNRFFNADGMASLHASYYFSTKSGYIETIRPGVSADVVLSFDVDPSSTDLRLRLTELEQPAIALEFT